MAIWLVPSAEQTELDQLVTDGAVQTGELVRSVQRSGLTILPLLSPSCFTDLPLQSTETPVSLLVKRFITWTLSFHCYIIG